MCLDGVKRKTFWYRCLKRGIKPGTPEHIASHDAAQKAAFEHVKRAVRRASGTLLQSRSGPQINLEYGNGPLHVAPGAAFGYHGDPYEGFKFHVHPASINFMRRGVYTWRPEKRHVGDPT